MTRQARSRRLVAAAALVAATALFAVGCTQGGADPAPTPSAPVRPAGVTPGAANRAVEEQILAAYRGHWADLVQAGRTADADSPLLAAHTAGRQLTASRDLLRGYRDKGAHLEGTVRPSPRIVTLSPSDLAPTRAVVEDCNDNSKWVEVGADGRVVPNTEPARDRFTSVVQRTGGTWKVVQNSVEANQC